MKDRFVDVIRNLYSDLKKDVTFGSKNIRLWIKKENSDDKMFKEAKLWHESAENVFNSIRDLPGGVSIEPLVNSSFTVKEKNFLTLENNRARTIYIEVGSPEFFYNLRNYD